MAKSGLSNSLLGKTVTPAYTGFGITCPHPGPQDPQAPLNMGEIHPCWPQNFRPNYAGQCTAKIEAAWTADNAVMVALVDPHGNCGEAYLKHLKIRQG